MFNNIKNILFSLILYCKLNIYLYYKTLLKNPY